MNDLLSSSYVWWIIIVFALIVILNLCRSKKETKQTRRRGIDRSGIYPRQYAVGWYHLCDSDDIRAGQLKDVFILGREMVAFRGDDEQKQEGGWVMPGTNCIQCPFHLWEFDGKDGRCTKIPYMNGKIPEEARLQTYPCVERYGLIMVWFHPYNEPPEYDAINIEELLEKRFEFRGTYRYPDIRMHLQEFTENAVDIQHFGSLHGQMLIPWTEWTVPFVTIQHESSVSFPEEGTWKMFFHNTAMLKVFGKTLQSTKVTASIIFHGPGSVTLFRFDGDLGRLYLFHTNTPTEYTKLNVVFRVFAERKISRFLSWYIVSYWIAQWQRDLFVGGNKVDKRTPFLMKNDAPVMRLRRWFNQFYISKEDSNKDVDINDW